MIDQIKRSKPGRFDIFIEIIAIIGLIALIVISIFYYSDLPDLIPRHFGISGETDAYGSKGIIWSLPVTGLLLYLLLTLINKFPHLFNYPVKVTEANAGKLYGYAIRANQFLKIIIIYSFLYINYKTIMIGQGKASGLGVLYLPVFLSLLGLLIGIMIYKMKKVN